MGRSRHQGSSTDDDDSPGREWTRSWIRPDRNDPPDSDDSPDSKLSRAFGWLALIFLVAGSFALLVAIPDSQAPMAASTEVILVAGGSVLVLVSVLIAVLIGRRRRLHDQRHWEHVGQIVVPDDGPAQDAPEPFSTSNPLPPAAKTWFLRLFAGITALLLAIAVACLVVGNPNAAGAAAFFAIFPALIGSAGLSIRLRPPRVEVSDTGIVVVNELRTHNIAWHDLSRVEYVDVKKDSGPTTQLCFFQDVGSTRHGRCQCCAPPFR